MRKFRVLLGKELKELLTPQMLLPFVVTVLLFAFIGQVVGAQADHARAAQPVLVVDQDRSADSALVVSALRASGFTPQLRTGEAAAALAALSCPGARARCLVVVPAGFGEGIATGSRPRLVVYSALRDLSVTGSTQVGQLREALAAVSSSLATRTLAQRAPGVDMKLLKAPMTVEDHVVLGDRQAAASPEAVSAFITQQTTFIPIVLFIVTMFAAQMVATTIANEKENKTLETMLSMPVTRGALVASKMLAAALVALLSAGAYMVGLDYYMKGLSRGLGGAAAGSGTALAKLGLSLSGGDYALLGLTLFLAILVAISIALILGAFAESVRAAQSLLMPLVLMLMLPYLLVMFLDIGSVSPFVRWLVYAIPFSHTFMAGSNLFLGQYGRVWAGAAYELVWVAAMLALAVRVFSSDRILTMRLNLRRDRGRAFGGQGGAR